jgi:hypothetical protein
MNVTFFVRTARIRSPGFSRIRCSRQDAPAPAGIPPADERYIFRPDSTDQESRLQPVLAFPAGCPGPGRHPTGSSRDSRMPYLDYFLNIHQPRTNPFVQ